MRGTRNSASQDADVIGPAIDGEAVGGPRESEVMLWPLLAAELAALHPRQRAAAIHDGNLVILAGPGAGKTRTLVARVGYLLAVTGPHRGVAAITYTDAAAREVTARLRHLCLSPGRRLASSTLGSGSTSPPPSAGHRWPWRHC